MGEEVNDVGTLLGIGGTVLAILAAVGAVVARDRQIHKTIDDKVGAVDQKIDREAANLHERVNRTRDDMVRQVDLQAHSNRIEGMISDVKAQLNILIQKMIKE